VSNIITITIIINVVDCCIVISVHNANNVFVIRSTVMYQWPLLDIKLFVSCAFTNNRQDKSYFLEMHRLLTASDDIKIIYYSQMHKYAVI